MEVKVIYKASNLKGKDAKVPCINKPRRVFGKVYFKPFLFIMNILYILFSKSPLLFHIIPVLLVCLVLNRSSIALSFFPFDLDPETLGEIDMRMHRTMREYDIAHGMRESHESTYWQNEEYIPIITNTITNTEKAEIVLGYKNRSKDLDNMQAPLAITESTIKTSHADTLKPKPTETIAHASTKQHSFEGFQLPEKYQTTALLKSPEKFKLNTNFIPVQQVHELVKSCGPELLLKFNQYLLAKGEMWPELNGYLETALYVNGDSFDAQKVNTINAIFKDLYLKTNCTVYLNASIKLTNDYFANTTPDNVLPHVPYNQLFQETLNQIHNFNK